MLNKERIICYSQKEVCSINVIMSASMRNFCFLLLTFVIIINNILFTDEITTPDMIPNYSTSTIAYAQQQQGQPASKSQEWIDRQSDTKVLFSYSPETPLVAASTDLIFDIQNLKTFSQLICCNG